MTSKRVLLLTHEALVPPDDVASLSPDEYRLLRTEADVYRALVALGHRVTRVGLYDELAPLRRALEEARPHVVFNLIEEFRERVVYDAHVVGYLELKQAAYTGCNPRGLLLARDKALSKKILSYHRIRVPRFFVVPRGRGAKTTHGLDYPLIVKSLVAEGSEGIAQASVVHNFAGLRERVAFIHGNLGTDAIVEQYIDGRELYVGVLGNRRLTVLPTWELFLEGLPAGAHRIATRRVKWDPGYQERNEILIGPAEGLSEALERRIERVARRVCRCLGLDGYVRIDFRLTADERLYFLEANPNPDVARDQEFSSAAEQLGLSYEELVQRIVTLGLRRHRGR